MTDFRVRGLGRVVLVTAVAAVTVPQADGGVIAWVVMLLAHLAIWVVLAATSVSLPWPAPSRAIALFVLLFAVHVVNIYIEILFFTVDAAIFIPAIAPAGTLRAALFATGAALLFVPPAIDATATADLNAWLRTHSTRAWVWRFALSVIAYVALYFVIGGIAFRFVEPYYTDPAYGMNLTLPRLRTVLLVQFIRGAIYVAALVPLLAGSRLPRIRLAILAGADLFVIGGLAPLLGYNDWPAALRFYHSIEIFFENFLAGVCIVRLLAPEPTTRTVHALEDTLPSR